MGNPNADLVFVGEAPGHNEDMKGEPFVGRAGKLLDKILAAVSLSRQDVYICNVLKCRPPENRNPSSEEIEKWDSEELAKVPLNVQKLMGDRNTRIWNFGGGNKPDNMPKVGPGIDPSRWERN